MSKNSQEMKDGDSGGFCQVWPNLSQVTSQLHPLLITQKLHPSITSHLYLNYIHYLLLKNFKSQLHLNSINLNHISITLEFNQSRSHLN